MRSCNYTGASERTIKLDLLLIGKGAHWSYSTEVSKVSLPLNYWKLWSATFISNIGNGVSAIAFPWLASALTRSPLTIAIVGLMSQLPWLLFTLPAGVITDRLDRKKIIVATDLIRGVVTALATIILIFHRNEFAHLNNPLNAYNGGSQSIILGMMMLSSFLLGSAEVLGNNSSQTFLPEVLPHDQLAKGNGQMWSAEYLTNSFIGPALGSLLLGIGIYLPFIFDAGSFFASAALIGLITVQARKIVKSKVAADAKDSSAFIAELREGFAWLMGHDVLRPMAFTLGALNFVSQFAFASFILFVQEVLHVSVFIFALLGTAGAAGGFLAGLVAPKVIKRIGDGNALTIALIGVPSLTALGFFVHQWYFFYILTFCLTFFVVMWNIVTVTFRQTIIPTEILGRVNSGYRFFAWGSMPLGSIIGGLGVNTLQHHISRGLALRIPFLVAGALGFITWITVRKAFTSEKLQAARNESAA